jgi:hypothetical protein
LAAQLAPIVPAPITATRRIPAIASVIAPPPDCRRMIEAAPPLVKHASGEAPAGL